VNSPTPGIPGAGGVAIGHGGSLDVRSDDARAFVLRQRGAKILVVRDVEADGVRRPSARQDRRPVPRGMSLSPCAAGCYDRAR
jgi:hypothetical protein